MCENKCKIIEKEEYDFECNVVPIWLGKEVFRESVMPIAEKDGSILPITLAYDIEKIYSVQSSDLTVDYEEGKDYTIENGKLCINKNGSIPVMDYADYYPDGKKDNVKPKTGGGNILFIEGGYFHTKQIAVTYLHNDVWSGDTPKYQGEYLKKTVKLLEEKKPIKMAFWGDSIFTGCNSSGTPMGGSQAPFLPSWFDLMIKKLKKQFGYDDITYVNRSRGGTKSFWGDELAEEYIANENPDLVWIGFGMNDRETPCDVYRNNIASIVSKIRAKNPDCEFILTAPMLANKEAEGFFREQVNFINELNSLKEDGVGVMDVTSVHKYLLTRKRYGDTTGNNLNHPNDFLCRVYAQCALFCLIDYANS